VPFGIVSFLFLERLSVCDIEAGNKPISVIVPHKLMINKTRAIELFIFSIFV